MSHEINAVIVQSADALATAADLLLNDRNLVYYATHNGPLKAAYLATRTALSNYRTVRNAHAPQSETIEVAAPTRRSNVPQT